MRSDEEVARECWDEIYPTLRGEYRHVDPWPTLVRAGKAEALRFAVDVIEHDPPIDLYGRQRYVLANVFKAKLAELGEP